MPSRVRQSLTLVMGSAMVFGLSSLDLDDELTLNFPKSRAEASRNLPPPPPNGEQGFVVYYFSPTYEGNADDCPEGFASMLRENMLATLSPAKRERVLQPDHEEEFNALYRKFAIREDGANICTNMEWFDRPAQKTVQGKTAAGFNLDGDASGDATQSGCAHDNFTGRDGTPGVDNQYWRAIGCLEKFRPHKGQPPQTSQHFGMSLANGENAQVILLRGVDSWLQDDDVEIIYANTPDRALVDSQRNFLHGASYAATNTPGGPNRFRGRIVNGTIEAHTPHLQLRQVYYLGAGLRGLDITGTRTKWDFRDAQLRLSLQPDGSIKGMLGGYQPVLTSLITPHLGGSGAALGADYDCAAMYAAVLKMADGHRDPETGQCTTISTTIDIKAVPAFVSLDEDSDGQHAMAPAVRNLPAGR